MDMMKLFDVKVGDAVGLVNSPGVSPMDNIGVVTGLGEDKFYTYAEATFSDGTRMKIARFVTNGLGIYHFPTYLTQK